jgi:hypothetical protein
MKVCIVIAVVLSLVGIILLAADVEAQGNQCQGKSCNPLPDHAATVVSELPAATPNPHINGTSEPVVEVTSIPSTPKPQATPEPVVEVTSVPPTPQPEVEETPVPPTSTPSMECIPEPPSYANGFNPDTCGFPEEPTPAASLPASQPSEQAGCLANGSDEDCSACDLLLAALDQGDAIILVSLENLNPDIIDSVTGEGVGVIVMSDGGAQVGGELLSTGTLGR